MWPLFIDGVQLAIEPPRGDSLLFTTKSPEIPDIHLIDHGRMEGWANLEPSSGNKLGIPGLGILVFLLKILIFAAEILMVTEIRLLLTLEETVITIFKYFSKPRSECNIWYYISFKGCKHAERVAIIQQGKLLQI